MRHIALAIAIATIPAATHAQTRANSTSTSPSGRYGAIGCLSKQGAGASARYQLTDPRGEKPTVYRLQGDTALLDRHVGKTIEVAGPLAAGPASGQYSLTVRSLVYLQATCRTQTGRTGVRP